MTYKLGKWYNAVHDIISEQNNLLVAGKEVLVEKKEVWIIAKTKLTFRINPFLVEQLAKEAEDDYRKNSEMLRLILEESQFKLPLFIEQLSMKKDLCKRSQQRGEGMSVYLESEMVSQLKQQTEKTSLSLNQLVNEILRTRYGCDE